MSTIDVELREEMRTAVRLLRSFRVLLEDQGEMGKADAIQRHLDRMCPKLRAAEGRPDGSFYGLQQRKAK